MADASKIFYFYENFGEEEYIGEDVSQVEHALQAAALAAEDNQPVGLRVKKNMP